MQAKARLIIAYRGKSGFWNGVLDSAHKLLSPTTYQCQLCKLTHGLAGAKEEWTRFIQDLDMDVAILHEDDDLQSLGLSHAQLPSIAWQESPNHKPRFLLDRDAIAACSGTTALITQLRQVLA